MPVIKLITMHALHNLSSQQFHEVILLFPYFKDEKSLPKIPHRETGRVGIQSRARILNDTSGTLKGS